MKYDKCKCYDCKNTEYINKYDLGKKCSKCGGRLVQLLKHEVKEQKDENL